MAADATGASPKPAERRDSVTILFAGDSGDGMQLAGMEFTKASARHGNDLATLPDYPAEIRAPAGSLSGVSGFQVHFGSREILTPGDQPDVLVAMNPAALKVNLHALARGGMVVVNRDAFDERGLKLAGYASNPLDDGSLAGYSVYAVGIATLATRAVEGLGLSAREAARCKNYYALGLLFWVFERAPEPELESIRRRFAKKQQVFAEANVRAFRAGYDFGETSELLPRFEVPPAPIAPGLYRHVTGNQAAALGLVAAARQSGRRLFLGTYPITPATEILHELATLKHHGVVTFQAEDEIAAVTSCVGAAFGGALAATTTSGPGMALKSEGLSLAVMLELPLVVIDVQRAGPSTGMPTKTEQSDLLFSLFGRPGESPLPVLAAATPSDLFDLTLEAARLALEQMTPVVLLSDGFLAQSAEPWRIPELEALPKIAPPLRTEPAGFSPYLRDPETLARPWALPGTRGLEHRIGGLEKDAQTGHISYDGLNHERMVRARAEKVARIAERIPPLEACGDADSELLVLGWGSSYGAITSAVRQARERGLKVAQAHLRYLNPMPKNTGELLRRYRRVLVPETNAGQLTRLLKAEFLVDPVGLEQLQGRPFRHAEILERIEQLLGAKGGTP